ncbi:hypothetical protein EXIGLDRAFT_832898 [Exidia glandulosa HHB12029]|uniref:Ubiquitin 3 binding protein But2 C-terminal domain-containing protein n=1 Tax=Exidia glandulosa HHB12029 TaxID=1314781 RepID=A0A165L4C1_EXIGL|nr:hypothetical protein EXIGLDRAFT_832898 [Exidia glandulosa HHB12029]
MKFTTTTLLFTTAALAKVHNETVVSSAQSVSFAPDGAWGAFNPLVPLVNCPTDTLVQAANPIGDAQTLNASVSYSFTGSAAYLQLVTGPNTCTGTFTLDGSDVPFTTTPAEKMGCTTVAGKAGLDASKQHTAKVSMSQGSQDGCMFLFAGFIVTLDGAPSSSSSSSSSSPGTGTGTTATVGPTDTVISTTSTGTDSSAPTATETDTGAASRIQLSTPLFVAALLFLAQ